MTTTSRRRFDATETTTTRALISTIKKMGATGLKLNQDFETGAVEIVFDRAGRRYVFRNAAWSNLLDNLRGTQLTISKLYEAMESYGTESSSTAKASRADPFVQFFAGFEALPDDSVLLLGSGVRGWWEVLGVAKTATMAEIKGAYRALARVHHPDTGGNTEDFKRVRAAYDEGMQAFGG